MNEEQTISGPGYHWNAETRYITILFELAEGSEDGSPAGVKMRVGPCGKTPTEEYLQQYIERVKAEGLNGWFSPSDLTPITAEEYKERGYGMPLEESK